MEVQFSLWEERERTRAEILAAVDKAEASLSRGEGRRITMPEGVKQLADDVRRRGMARLAAEQRWPFADGYLPMQKVEKIRFRISSAVVAPLMPSSGRSAA